MTDVWSLITGHLKQLFHSQSETFFDSLLQSYGGVVRMSGLVGARSQLSTKTYVDLTGVNSGQPCFRYRPASNRADAH
jgi:hypothetical protein